MEQAHEQGEVRRTPQERNVDRIERVLDARHERALAIVALEERLRNTTFSHEEHAAYEEDPFSFTQEVIARHEPFIQAVTEEQNEGVHSTQATREAIVTHVDKAMRAIRSEIRVNATLEQAGETSDGLTRGAYLCKSLTGYEPKGAVVAGRTGGVLTLAFDESRDLSQFLGDPEDEDVSTLGTYHESIDVEGELVDILAYKKHGEESPLDVIKHEQQHFVTGTFFDLRGIEEHYELVRKGDTIERMHGACAEARAECKDEILARLREGATDAHAIIEFFVNPNYDELFEKLTPNEHEELCELGDSIEHALVPLLALCPHPRARAVIAYQLINAPLARFPERCEMLKKYYAAQVGVDLSALPSRVEHAQARRGVADPERKRELGRVYEELTSVARQLQEVVFGSPNANPQKDADTSENSAALRDTYARILARYQELRAS